MGSELTSDNSRSCMDTPMNMYSSKVYIKRLTGAFFLADIQTMTSTYVGILGMHPCFYIEPWNGYGRLATGKGRHARTTIKMASGVQEFL